MSAQIQAERSQRHKWCKGQAASCQHRLSRSCSGVAVGHSDDPARVPPAQAGAEATEGPCSHMEDPLPLCSCGMQIFVHRDAREVVQVLPAAPGLAARAARGWQSRWLWAEMG